MGFLPNPIKKGASAAALAHLADEPVVMALNECKSLSKLLSTWGTVHRAIHDGRLDYHFKEGRTFRLYTHDYNVIGLPKQFRTFVRPHAPEGVFVHMDWRAAELLLLAHEAGLTEITEAYREDVDVHVLTAAKMLGKPFEDVTPRERDQAKQISYAILYGGSTRENQEKFFDLYPGSKSFLRDLVGYAERSGQTETIQGQVITLDMTLPEWPFQAANYRYQGTVGLLLQQKIVDMSREFPDVRMRVPSFDSMLLEVPGFYQASYLYDLVKEFGSLGTVLAGPHAPYPDFHVNVKVGNSWGEMSLWPNLDVKGPLLKDHVGEFIYR
jgi:DNA polymerase-1